MEKHQSGYKKYISKIVQCARLGNTTVPKKKFTSIFATTGIFFSITRFGFRHWVTGITNLTTGIYYDMICNN